MFGLCVLGFVCASYDHFASNCFSLDENDVERQYQQRLSKRSSWNERARESNVVRGAMRGRELAWSKHSAHIKVIRKTQIRTNSPNDRKQNASICLQYRADVYYANAKRIDIVVCLFNLAIGAIQFRFCPSCDAWAVCICAKMWITNTNAALTIPETY